MDPVRAHLEEILASEGFRLSRQASAVLRYLVGSALEKRVPKEYSIATEALGRAAGFDPRADPAVRVAVRRLRQKLLEYYSGAGRDAALAFELPKGGYALAWRERWQPAAPTAIAVLPFTNLTGDPAKEFFVDGLTEELTSELARAADLRVVARTSAFAFKGTAADVREIGRRLDVSTLVEGSVRWSDGVVRATVQLIDANSGYHRWAHSYEAAERDIVGCQQELAIQIREALLLRITPGEAGLSEPGPPVPEAYPLMLRARYHWHARTADDVGKAMRLLDELTARYPDYAAPWAARAECYCALGLDAPARATAYGELALACSERALVLAPKLAEAHAARGWALGQYRFDHAAGERHLKRAMEIKPGYMMAHYVWSMAACTQRRFDEALRYAESAAVLDPLSMVAHRGVAYVWFARGHLDRARERVLQALDLAPGAAFATQLHGLIEAEAGQTDLGLQLLQRAVAQAGGTWPLVEGFMAYYQARAGQAAEAASTERRLAALDSPSHIALALAALGRHDVARAVDLLDQAAGEGDAYVVHLADHPPFPQLRAEPRARALYRRLNLPANQP